MLAERAKQRGDSPRQFAVFEESDQMKGHFLLLQDDKCEQHARVAMTLLIRKAYDQVEYYKAGLRQSLADDQNGQR